MPPGWSPGSERESPPAEFPASEVGNAIAAARRFLLSSQQEDGHWCAELEGDTILESEYILTFFFLGRAGEPKVAKAAEYLRRSQLPTGGWAIYAGGPPEVSASVKAYFALKLLGDGPEMPHMARARRVIRDLGGIEACNSFTRIYLSIFGQWDWARCPAVPPELMLLPDSFPISIYRMSAWSRTIVVPLSIIWAKKPRCPVPEGAGIGELSVPGASRAASARSARERIWRSFFGGIDPVLKLVESSRATPLRARALREAEAWIHAHLEGSDGLGAIFPPIVNTIIAFRCLGYALDDPRLTRQVRELERLEIEDEETLRVQPCFSPVWDTALAIGALRVSGSPADEPAVLKAAAWLLDREVRTDGDWKRSNPDVEPGGWAFEYANAPYPDTDDSAEVLTALAGVRFPDGPEERRRESALARGVAWQLAMQNADGGWGAFDKGCDNEVLTFIPFADHNAMIDPSSEDITGRTLTAFEELGLPKDHGGVRGAVSFLLERQCADGTWYGRWGCNYLYGTWLALRGLASARAHDAERFGRAADWVRRHQNEDGGWGELPLSYDEQGQKGVGPSTASQTAWALMALFETGDLSSASVVRGVAYLLRTQKYDGSWTDESWTGTGFPKVFYLRYHGYATYFPLWALAAFAQGEAPGSRAAVRRARQAGAAVAGEEGTQEVSP